jgi:glyoxylase-like metal-dependent hydrolase (beta-lactamase superfamily II)
MAPEQGVADETGKTGTVHRIEFDVEWPPGHAAVYLLLDDEPILVDAGMPGTGNEGLLHEELAAIGLDAGDIDHVVITHPHVDHVGLMDVLVESGDPTVYAPATYREVLDRPRDVITEGIHETVERAGLPEAAADRAAERSRERVDTIHSLLPEEWVDVWMADGESVAVGDRAFEATLTPGHQRDHLVLATELDREGSTPERALFSGDMAIRPFRAAAVHSHFGAEQTEGVTAYYESLDRLGSLDVDRVYPGHGPVHDEFEESIETARESLDRLLDRTERTVRPSGTHAAHVANERADDPTDGPWLPEAVAALAHLERLGRLESYLEDGTRFYTPV